MHVFRASVEAVLGHIRLIQTLTCFARSGHVAEVRSYIAEQDTSARVAMRSKDGTEIDFNISGFL